ncbi:MAG: hypothetical protein EOP52_01575 [Sphingobacteriales bacterium]|nr:MAG: hypothetical protein EOP52_01575 [Sphingobacteriales bacterium]
MQTIVPQLLGIALFVALSQWLPKETFGLMGWYTATSYVLVVLGSFGLEQIVYRRVAAGRGSGDWAAKAFWVHNLAVTLVLLILLAAGALLFPSAKTDLLPVFFATQAMLSLATPFRLLLNARLQFKPYAIATILANGAKLLGAYVIYRSGTLSLLAVGLVMLGGNALEYILAWRTFRKAPKQVFRPNAYRLLLKEAVPQYLAVVFDVLLSRVDWILIGVLATTTALADYSFAYRAYEVERLPVTLMSSLLLPIVVRNQTNEQPSPALQTTYRSLLLLVPLLMSGVSWMVVLFWKPVVGGMLNSEFGNSSYLLIGILNLSLVFQFAINQLWIQAFAARKYVLITRITLFTALLNLLCNLVLIPRLNASGAAWSIVISTIFQFGCYAVGVRKIGFPVPVLQLTGFFLLHVFLFGMLVRTSVPTLVVGGAILLIYPVLLWATGLLNGQKLWSLLNFRKAL